MEFATKAVHSGNEPEPTTGSIMPPIYMTSTYIQEAPGVNKGYEYTRANNPNFTILENLLAALENAKYATVFSSGLGALTAMVSGLSYGDKVIAIDGLYGGTYRLFTQVFNRFGIEFSMIHPKDQDAFAKALASKPKCLFFETPTNPLLEVFDIVEIARKAKENGIAVIVDNTFASPYCQNPLDLGADIVWHSTTKYLGGHSDVIGGVAMTNHLKFKEDFDFARKALGLNPSPFDVWLTNRGVKTLAVRMERHQKNAAELAEFLQKHPKVKKVFYPGLKNHPSYEIAKKQMKGFSGMLSAEFHLSLEETKKLISSFSIFSLAESLGGVESLVCHPSTMTHASIPQEEREKMGIADGLVRFSVGIEDIRDLKKDLETSLEKF
jgi:cystathionine beta-lyase/cystathionine gamma-synthase